MAMRWLNRSKTNFLVAVVVAAALTGCGMGSPDKSSAVDSVPLAVKGTVFGGRQPISGATITIYAFGTGGYGQGAASRGSVTSATDGSFVFAAGANTCINGDTLYIVASGGNPGSGVDNPASVLMSLLGSCSASKTAVVNINELSTIASMFSLAQYFNPSTESFGHSSTYSTGLLNAVATASVLADLTHGLANTSVASAPTNTITMTPESQKMNLMANMLAACVNSNQSASVNSSACSTLFSNAVPPPNGVVTSLGASASFTAAADTLMVAYYLAVNPINASTLGIADPAHTSNLAAVAVANSPYQPSLASTPKDWTLAIDYTANFTTGSGANVGYPFSATSTPMVDSTGGLFFLSLPPGNQLRTRISASGIYTSSAPSTPSTFSPLSPASTLDGDNNTYYAPIISSGAGNGVYETPNPHNFSPVYNTNYEFYTGMAADGSSTTLGTSTFAQIVLTDAVNGNLYVLPSSTTTTTKPPLTLLASSLALSGAGPYGLALDQSGNAWVAETGSDSIAKATYNSVTAPQRITSSAAFRNPIALAADHSNNLWVANPAGSGDNGFLTYVNTTSSTPVADTTANDGGINNPVGVAVDGAGNVWVANAGQTVGGTHNVGQSVSELAYVGSAFVPLSSSGSAAGFAHDYNAPSGLAIDGSGNVWVTNSGAIASSSTSGLITEIIGAAVPVVTPIALGIRNSTLASKP
jgi:hypothetical protein